MTSINNGTGNEAKNGLYATSRLGLTDHTRRGRGGWSVRKIRSAKIEYSTRQGRSCWMTSSAYPPYKGGPLASMALSTENGATPSLAETLIMVLAVGLVRLHIQIDGREDCCFISR